MADEGLDRSAILMILLGEQEAAEVFKHLSPRDVQRLGEAMTKVSGIAREKLGEVLEQFHNDVAKQSSFGIEGGHFLRNVLTSALGAEKAELLLERIVENTDTPGIERLKWVDPVSVANLIRNEHPQIIATILVHLEQDQSAAILAELPPRLRNDVVLRIATMDSVEPHAMRELNDSLLQQMAATERPAKKSIGGVTMAAGILNLLPGAAEGEAVESIREFDIDLAQKVEDEMFKFENLLELDDRAVQTLLREVASDALIVALKGADVAMREKIFKNMSERASAQMREDLETRGPVRLSEVEAQQREILKTVRRLAEEGTLVLAGKADDAFV